MVTDVKIYNVPKLSVKDKIDGNELDLSLNGLTEVPVKELALFKKATHLDLSCNHLEYLPSNFATLTHLVKIDLSKNVLKELPDNFGNLINLQYLDLYGNQLKIIPVSFCRLKNLKWLDLKDNPLDPKLKIVAGDCLDEKQCHACAKKVVSFMQTIESDLEREKQKKLKEQREKEAAAKLLEEQKLEEQRKLKKAEREKRKAESKARKQEAQKQSSQAEHLGSSENASKGSKKNVNSISDVQNTSTKSGFSWIKCVSLLFTFPLIVVLAMISLRAYETQTVRSFDDLLKAFEESYLEVRDISSIWWNGFFVPYFFSARDSIYQYWHAMSLFNITNEL